MSALAPARVGWCPGALRPMETGDGLVLRVKPHGGVLGLATAEALAALALRFGNGDLDLTGRANLQIRGVRDGTVEPLVRGLHDLGLLDPTAEAEAVRNVVASPLAGLDHGALLDIRPVVAALEARLVGDETLWGLPAKWSVLVDDGGAPGLAGVPADIRFEAAPDGTMRVGLAGDPLRAHCTTGDVADVAAALSRRALDGEPKRMDALVRERGARAVFTAAGLSPTLSISDSTIGGRPPSPLAGEGGSRRRRETDEGAGAARSPSSGASHLRWPPQPASQAVAPGQLRHLLPQGEKGSAPERREYGWTLGAGSPPPPVAAPDVVGWHRFGATPVFGVAAPFGSLRAEDLLALLASARAAGASDLRLTPWRVLLLAGVTEMQAAAIGRAVRDRPLIVRPDDPRLAIAACSGMPACLRATTPVREHATALAAMALSLPPTPGSAIHVSGCAKGCAHPMPAPWTLVGRAGRYDLVRHGKAGDAPVAEGLTFQEAARRLSREPHAGTP